MKRNKLYKDGYIYEYISPSNKYYIGQTTALVARKSQHLHSRKPHLPIDRAIIKYGIESFQFNILFHTSSKDKKRLRYLLNTMEVYYIKKYKKEGKILYNILDGGNQGNGIIWDTPHRNRMREVMLNRRRNGYTGNLGHQMKNHVKQALFEANHKKVLQYSLDGKLIKLWKGVAHAGRSLGILESSISNCLTGRSKKAGGFIWKYYNE